MNELMNSVCLQIQRAINEAINDPVLPHLQATLTSVNGQYDNSQMEDGTSRVRDRNVNRKILLA